MARKSAQVGVAMVLVLKAGTKPADIARALRTREVIEKLGGMARIRTALRHLEVTERFVKRGNRYKKRFTKTKNTKN